VLGLVLAGLPAAGLTACGRSERPVSRVLQSTARRTATPRLVGPSTAPEARQLVTIGRSVRGRSIVARVLGDPRAGRRILVIGCVHGDEPAGIAVTRSLRTASVPKGVGVWVIDTVNPDGLRARTRQNADGVDLNRTFPVGWKPLGGIFDSGRRPLAEPESRAIHRLIIGLHPAVTIWYHQHAALVDDSGGSAAIERAYARLVGLPFRHFGNEPGSITAWQNATYSASTAFVVELPAGALSHAAVARHVAAVLALAAG
jgi:protein MpaA